MVSDTFLSNKIYFTQQNYLHETRLYNNTTIDPSDSESVIDNIDDKIQVLSYVV